MNIVLNCVNQNPVSILFAIFAYYMANTLKNICCILLAMLSTMMARALDVSHFTYSHIGVDKGMLSQRVYSIRQSADGAVWWAAKNGVERYNGVSVKQYQTGEPSMFSNYAGRILKLSLGPDSALYAFDNKGSIFVYDPCEDAFEPYDDLARQLGTDVLLNDILVTDSGMWLAMREGVFCLRDHQLKTIVRGVYANTIVQTADRLLFCNREGVMDSQQRTLLNYHVESGYYDAVHHKVWLGGFQNGFHIFTENGDGTLTECELAGTAISNPVRSICPYDDETMLVGIDGMGVYQVSRQSDATGRHQAMLLFDANEGKEGVLHGNGVYAVIRDSWNNIIVGSYSGGIDIARPVGSTPAIFQHIRSNMQSLLNDHVNCVSQLPDGTLLMGTDNGISVHNPFTRQWTHYCRGAVVLSMCLTPQGTVLASTYGKGVFEIDKGGQVRQLYSESNQTLKDNHVYKVYIDSHGDLWMGCLDGDLVQKTAAGFRYYSIKNVQDIVEMPEGRIAVATADGIKLISGATAQVTELDYAINPDDVNRFVQALYVNDGRQLWIGTDGGGVYIYDLLAHKTVQVTKTDGLPSNSVMSMTKDNRGRIMIATDKGLAFVHPASPEKVFCVNYCYGIEREYSARATFNMHNGHILYGTSSGALIVNPENVQEINYTAKLRIQGVNSPTLSLSYDERTFDLHYECINLRNQFDIVYQYKVGDGEWNEPTDEQYIRFTNLEPGVHDLHLRAVSRTCGAVLDEVELPIRIGQPWWNSWWMWLVYVALLLLAFCSAWQVYRLHSKYMRLVVGQIDSDRLAAVGEEASEPADSPQPELQEEQEQEGSAFIDKVTQLVVKNLSDTDFNIDRLCREMAMSRTLFYIKLKSYTGKSPQDFIRIIRLERAATMLRNRHPVNETATLTGFDNPKYFSTVFKKYFGVSPSKYCQEKV